MAMGEFSEYGDSPQREKHHRSPFLYTRARRRSSLSHRTLHRRGNLLSVSSDMSRGEAMTPGGWRQGLGDLARDVMRVLFIYAIVLQTLAPLAVAQAEAGDGLKGHRILCSAMAGAGSEQPAKAPALVVHDCLSCCLGSMIAILAVPSEWVEPISYSLPIVSSAPKVPVLPTRVGSPPPQRAPPGLV